MFELFIFFSYSSYYVWLILQGFPELVEKCYWIILVGTEEVHNVLGEFCV